MFAAVSGHNCNLVSVRFITEFIRHIKFVLTDPDQASLHIISRNNYDLIGQSNEPVHLSEKVDLFSILRKKSDNGRQPKNLIFFLNPFRIREKKNICPRDFRPEKLKR